ncbi:uncharacterized protein LOC109724170 isoform X2 [Ananas comosus]|nr:uncharacterized protein LOC109706424 isoform X2 [Ananas comosus]XP_020082822.1 uncharacterized protein LOC109706424 isoform X2 [Ananas comosus]XP_020108486.1 uncharacterized protein LOC109724170 isoform X2 [Ananas comosus]XP_020108487.1 uncharacterized protein LOC109724170 isoform X2 [Ananas comosus]
MDFVELENNQHVSEAFSDQLSLPSSPGTNEIYDESPICPRIGEQFQVGIPNLATEAERQQLWSCPTDNGLMLRFNYPVGIGLSIPIMWVHHQNVSIKEEGKDSKVNRSGCKEENSYDHGTLSKTLICKVESGNDQEYIPLPGSSTSSWSDVEAQCFLLGLYIFGKNLEQLRKFVVCKMMGDILSYYYGSFYRSEAYRRWSECRKIRSRRCILGQRIFTGWRQQELLSRLLPAIPKGAQDSLLEVVKSFNEGRASFEEFIFTLKSIVGTQALIEAIGIGKGKQDLTGVILDPIRSNQPASSRSEIPVGKACSSLTSSDIIKFLTGDFRLSKARSNDLFWEAVWPRLLARGWHSEQPKHLNTVGSKNTLVFLMPSIKKFSRKKLVKGDHYFDSVSDVLSKVASDPRLLELEGDGVDENGWAVDTSNTNKDGMSDQHRRSYLRPKLPNCNSELMKFTVVDTSLVQGEGPFKVRELRSLPIDVAFNYEPSSAHSTKSESSSEQSDSDESSLDDQGSSDQHTLDDKNLGKSTNMEINGHVSDGQLFDALNSKTSIKDEMCYLSQRTKPGQQVYLSPIVKRRRLAATSKYDGSGRRTAFARCHQLNKEETDRKLDSPKANEVGGEDALNHRNKAIDSSTKDSPGEGKNHVKTEEKAIKEEPHLQPHSFIDLNIPQEPPEHEIGENLSIALSVSKDGPSNSDKRAYTSETKPADVETSNNETNIEMKTWRQSTRNRPPTTRALEALACGFIGTKRKSRDVKVPSSRPSRRARKPVEAHVPSSSPSIGDSSPVIDDLQKSNMNNTVPLSESHPPSDTKGTHELGVP